MIGKFQYAFFCTFLCLVAFDQCFSQDTTTTTLYFDTDQYNLVSNHKTDLLSVIEVQLSEDSITSAHIIGYADRRGMAAYNIALSQRRVNSISQYLNSSYHSRLGKIRSQALGASLAGTNLQHDRRVDISFYSRPKTPTAYNTAIEIQDFSNIDETLLKKGVNLKIKNLNFQPGRSKLLRSSIPQLKSLEQLLRLHNNLSLRIEGHVCCSTQLQGDNDGTDVDNNSNNLSEARAKNIYDYLIKKGIQQNRLSYIGFGHSRPLIDPEHTEQDRSMNRRVEFLITKS